jgi:hypothetical protein
VPSQDGSTVINIPTTFFTKHLTNLMSGGSPMLVDIPDSLFKQQELSPNPIPNFTVDQFTQPIVPISVSPFILWHAHLFESSFLRFPSRCYSKHFTVGRDTAFRLIQLRDQHILLLHKPKFTLPAGTYFTDSELSPKAWLQDVKEQGNFSAASATKLTIWNTDLHLPNRIGFFFAHSGRTSLWI